MKIQGLLAADRLRAYLDAEAEMLRLDDEGNESEADAVRDRMDSMWYALDDADREWLNQRRYFDE